MRVFDVVISAFLLASGLVMLILSAALPGTYWTFLILLPIAMMIVPAIACPPSKSGEPTFRQALGEFTTGALLACIFGIPIVLHRVEKIGVLATVLSILGVFTIFISGAYYQQRVRQF